MIPPSGKVSQKNDGMCYRLRLASMSGESNEHRFPRVAGIENGYSIHTCSNELGPVIEAGKTWNGQKITISFTLPEKPGGALVLSWMPCPPMKLDNLTQGCGYLIQPLIDTVERISDEH
jgi:hypothetical protein